MLISKISALVSVTCLVSAILSSNAFADEASLQRAMNAQQNQINQMQRDIASLHGELEQIRYLLSKQQGGGNYQQQPNNPPMNGNQYNNNMGGGIPVDHIQQNNGYPQNNYPQNNYPTNNNVGQPNNGYSQQGPVTPMGNPNYYGNNNASSAPAPQQPAQNSGPVLKPVDQTAKQMYDNAYAKVKQNDLKGAQEAFDNYVRTYPDNSLTPNAWYWLGQVQYSQALYDLSRVSFLNVARFTNSQKRPDALYKLGMIHKFMGDTDKARRYYQLVIQFYPNDAAASLANRELQRM